MQNPNAIVSLILKLDPPLDRSPAEMLKSEAGITVELEDGRRARLNPADTRSPGLAQILDELSKQRLLVYLEIDPATSAITRLLIPHISRVHRIESFSADSLRIDLERSHARHFLKRDTPNFAEMEKLLNEALKSDELLIVTDDDAHNILDVRPFKPRPDVPAPPPLPKPEPTSAPSWLLRLLRWIRDLPIWRWPIWPWKWWNWLFRCISETRAQEVFDAMSATNCNPLTALSPCIPFLYPDNGCWARANQMCRLMFNVRLKPRKVWINGNLKVSTKNNPSCSVSWGWHVAPVLCVRGPGIFQSQQMVIDPSLFSAPVTVAIWKGVQGDSNATLTFTSASIFTFFGGSTTDPTYWFTDQDLAFYRLMLKTRSNNVGPPPYANC
jgi:hypothetical protein